MRAAFAILSCAMLCGCVQPPKRNPAPASVSIPEAWSIPAAAGAVADRWWEQFGSAELNQIVVETLERNFDLQAAAARVEAAEEEARIAGAALIPTVDATFDAARAQRAFVGLPIPGAPGGVLKSRATSYGVGLVSSWELDLWGRIRAGKQAALAEFQASEEGFRAAQQSLAGQTVKAWVALTEAQQQVSLAERNLQTYHTTASEVRARYERGIRSPLDVRLALANEASARAALADRRTALERARRQLDILRGLHPRGGSSPAAALPEAPGEVPAGLPSELLTRRPDVAQAERRLAAAQSRTKQARAARFPRLALTGSGGTTTAELSDLLNQDFSVWSIGANVAAPILDGGRRRASVRQAEARAREAQALYGAAILNAFREVENGLAAEALQREREAQVVQAWDHARAAAVLAEDRYRSGLEDIITLLESQRRSAEAESLALAVRRQRLENRIHLHLALGGGFNRKSEAASLIHKQEQTP